MSNLQQLLNVISDSVDYSDLVGNLENETQYIIKNCSMKGEGHKQLHLVLHPILDGILSIENATEINDKKKAITAINKSLVAYFNFFEVK